MSKLTPAFEQHYAKWCAATGAPDIRHVGSTRQELLTQIETYTPPPSGNLHELEQALFRVQELLLAGK